ILEDQKDRLWRPPCDHRRSLHLYSVITSPDWPGPLLFLLLSSSYTTPSTLLYSTLLYSTLLYSTQLYSTPLPRSTPIINTLLTGHRHSQKTQCHQTSPSNILVPSPTPSPRPSPAPSPSSPAATTTTPEPHPLHPHPPLIPSLQL
ncbi:hypothetical protein BO70DRAFT_377511, partial [Aspergillus heteromorphus CBS 117.55]